MDVIVRRRTGYLLGETVKFDMGLDTPMQSQKPGLNLFRIRHLNDNSRVFPVHFSHNGSGTHDEMTAAMRNDHNFSPAHDGLVLDL